MRKGLVLFLFLLFFGGCSERPLGEVPFDPTNKAHLAEIYVRTVFFKDFAAFERYGVTEKHALEYTRAISRLANDPEAWPRFLARVEKVRTKLQSAYAGAPP